MLSPLGKSLSNRRAAHVLYGNPNPPLLHPIHYAQPLMISSVEEGLLCLFLR